MKYFQLSQDVSLHNIVKFRIKTANPLQRRIEVKKEDVSGLDGVFRFSVESNPNNVFPDILDVPIFLVSDRIAEVFKYHFTNEDFRAVLLTDMANKQHKLYWLPIIDHVDCLHESTEYGKDGFLKNIVIDKAKVEDHKIFRIRSKHESLVAVRVEIAESLLRRGCEGVSIVPIQTTCS